MKKSEIIAVAKEIAKGKVTAKAVAEEFKGLVAKYGKEDAIKVQACAKEMVNAKKANITAQATSAIDILKDGERVGASAWQIVLKDKTSRAFATIIYQSCNCDLSAMLRKYCSYVDKEGNIYSKGKDGYKVKDLTKVGSYLSALKQAIRNAKQIALGKDYGKVCTLIVEE